MKMIFGIQNWSTFPLTTDEIKLLTDLCKLSLTKFAVRRITSTQCVIQGLQNRKMLAPNIAPNIVHSITVSSNVFDILDCLSNRKLITRQDISFDKNSSVQMRVSGQMRVFGKTGAFSQAWISGEARVSGRAQVSGEAWVSGDIRIYYFNTGIFKNFKELKELRVQIALGSLSALGSNSNVNHRTS